MSSLICQTVLGESSASEQQNEAQPFSLVTSGQGNKHLYTTRKGQTPLPPHYKSLDANLKHGYTRYLGVFCITIKGFELYSFHT